MCGGGEFRVFQFRLGNDPEEGRYRYFRRECKANSNNLAARYPKLSAIDVTEKAFFERLYLVLGLVPTDALGELSVCSTQWLILDFLANFCSARFLPLIFVVSSICK